MVDNESRRQAQRQARGLRRLEMILDTAASVFAEVGYADATMNMIASRASMSPGSLYQFFPNKGALAHALATRNIEQLHAFYEQILLSNLAEMPLPVLIDHFIDPLVELNRQHPEYYALFAGSQLSPELAAILKDFHQTVIENVAVILGHNLPAISQEERQRAALLLHRIFLAIIPLILEEDKQGNTPILNNMKSIFVNYLALFA